MEFKTLSHGVLSDSGKKTTSFAYFHHHFRISNLLNGTVSIEHNQLVEPPSPPHSQFFFSRGPLTWDYGMISPETNFGGWKGYCPVRCMNFTTKCVKYDIHHTRHSPHRIIPQERGGEGYPLYGPIPQKRFLTPSLISVARIWYLVKKASQRVYVLHMDFEFERSFICQGSIPGHDSLP